LPALRDAERATMLVGVAAIEAAVRQTVTVIDGLGTGRIDAAAGLEETS